MEFLVDATLGLINIEQNKVIKIFSIAAVVFLPPTPLEPRAMAMLRRYCISIGAFPFEHFGNVAVRGHSAALNVFTLSKVPIAGSAPD